MGGTAFCALAKIWAAVSRKAAGFSSRTRHHPRSRTFLQIVCGFVGDMDIVAWPILRVVRAYRNRHSEITISKVFPLMGSSMVGSLIQLPGVGGGSQLGTISVLQHIFNVAHELAANCGILLWLVTFVSVVPAGLVLAQYERLSLRKLSAGEPAGGGRCGSGPSSTVKEYAEVILWPLPPVTMQFHPIFKFKP